MVVSHVKYALVTPLEPGEIRCVRSQSTPQASSCRSENMKVSSLVTAAVLCALGTTAMAQSTAQPRTTTGSGSSTMDQTASDHDSMDHSGKSDSKLTSESFAKKAAAGGLAEVEMGKLAAQKATDPQLKKFGQQLVTDHTKGNKDLMSAVSGKAADLPSSP